MNLLQNLKSYSFKRPELKRKFANYFLNLNLNQKKKLFSKAVWYFSTVLLALNLQKKKKIDLKAYKNISVSWFSFNRITYLSKFIDSCTENWEGYHFHSFFLKEDRNFVSIHSFEVYMHRHNEIDHTLS